MKRISLVGFFLFLIVIPAVADGTEEKLQARAVLWSLQEDYQLDVVEKWVTFDPPIASKRGDTHSQAAGMAVRDVRIRCIDHCTKNLTYDEEVPDMIMGVFSYGDVDNEFITIWGGATAIWVRIYRVENDRIVKVMEDAAKGAPQFIFDKDGATQVVMTDDMAPMKKYTRHFTGQIWKSQSGRYAPIGK